MSTVVFENEFSAYAKLQFDSVLKLADSYWNQIIKYVIFPFQRKTALHCKQDIVLF